MKKFLIASITILWSLGCAALFVFLSLFEGERMDNERVQAIEKKQSSEHWMPVHPEFAKVPPRF